MLLSLSSLNVIQYLQNADLFSSEDRVLDQYELKESSQDNQNLLVTFTNNRQLLIKQKYKIDIENNHHELFNEWLFHQLLQQFPILGNISELSSLILCYDQENSILVRSYLSEYIELGKFYQNSSIFPIEIANSIGTALAELHRTTFLGKEYRDFMNIAPPGEFRYHFYNPSQGIDSINPDVLGRIPTEAIKFHIFYQHDQSLASAIADLSYEWTPCCLIHNDLQLSNILLHSRWEQLDNCLIRLIDWEACSWGDPAFDLGSLLASYLRIWLSSLVVDNTLNLEESLNLAMIPLDIIQPSMLALLRAYLDTFPLILEYRHDLILRVVQFTGLSLIHQIKEMIEYKKYFDQHHIYMLEFGKNILTMPQKAVLTIFGISESEIIQPVADLENIFQPEEEEKILPIYYEKTRLRGC
ncbi:aminoglycoside phosphotransferase family protein [Cronbergia sp. UHCC 0137]|uniref:phosphotransferase family protein n=1 Tax=Cronbergia sp. UHCC 0137 TaxID=3110239 RepID=UPI002B1E92AF|nr:aminoglycoside phosphotransferase family protein [Cronbergia sp. UHCC 0137]MEA5619525.1 aminoglycoside phosphotransferase family protein [Cronbergia sp. UHCC 0137]